MNCFFLRSASVGSAVCLEPRRHYVPVLQIFNMGENIYACETYTSLLSELNYWCHFSGAAILMWKRQKRCCVQNIFFFFFFAALWHITKIHNWSLFPFQGIYRLGKNMHMSLKGYAHTHTNSFSANDAKLNTTPTLFFITEVVTSPFWPVQLICILVLGCSRCSRFKSSAFVVSL